MCKGKLYLRIQSIFMIQDYIDGTVSVIGENQDCGSGHSVTCTKAVLVKVNDTEVYLKQGKLVEVNGIEITPPFVNQHVSVRRASSKFHILEAFGMSLKWDGIDRLYITLAPSYMNKVRFFTTFFLGYFTSLQEESLIKKISISVWLKGMIYVW